MLRKSEPTGTERRKGYENWARMIFAARDISGNFYAPVFYLIIVIWRNERNFDSAFRRPAISITIARRDIFPPPASFLDVIFSRRFNSSLSSESADFHCPYYTRTFYSSICKLSITMWRGKGSVQRSHYDRWLETLPSSAHFCVSKRSGKKFIASNWRRMCVPSDSLFLILPSTQCLIYKWVMNTTKLKVKMSTFSSLFNTILFTFFSFDFVIIYIILWT